MPKQHYIRLKLEEADYHRRDADNKLSDIIIQTKATPDFPKPDQIIHFGGDYSGNCYIKARSKVVRDAILSTLKNNHPNIQVVKIDFY